MHGQKYIKKLRVNVIMYCALEAKLLGISIMASLQEASTLIILRIL